jgi:formiminoglutamase
VKLPLVISVPHAGLRVPSEAEPYCVLSREQIAKDGDEGAAETYRLADEVEIFHTTDVARAIIDLNRAEEDRHKDGVVKTHTCWDVPVYCEPLPEAIVETLLVRYHRPYHAALAHSASAGCLLALDCHTMASHGPPVGPDPGVERPAVCIGDGGGLCPPRLVTLLRDCLAHHFPGEVTINRPFAGGYITRAHGAEMPWIQLELSRAPFLSWVEKRIALLAALRDFCAVSASSSSRP